MTVAWSPQHILTEQLGRRNFVFVPKDQLYSLSKEGSWALNLVERQGVPLVPDHVLNSVTQSYLRRRTHAVTGNAGADANEAVDASVRAAGGGQAPVRAQDAQEIDDASQPMIERQTTPSSWASSPARSPTHNVEAVFESQIARQLPSHDDDHITRMSSKLDDRHQHQSPDSHQRTNNVEDEEEEMDIDMHLPQAKEDGDARINLNPVQAPLQCTPAATGDAQLMNETPSCAQPQIIPATIVSSTPVAPKFPQHKFKPLSFDFPIKRASPDTSFTRMPSMTRLAGVNSSMATSSSSLIPATCATALTQTSTGRPAAAEDLQPSEATPQSRAEKSPSPSPRQATPINEPATPRQRQASQQQFTPSPTQVNMYAQFKTTYPDYVTTHSGSFKNFIKACLCLEYLASERAIREALYDEFIRAFSAGYLDYVRKAQRRQEPLPAIEWFNMLRGRPVFSKMVITTGTLAPTLLSFPEEVARARRHISIGRSGKPASATSRSISEPNEPGSRNGNDVTEEDRLSNHTPGITPPGPARRRSHGWPYSRPDSEGPELPRVESIPSARSRAPIASQYFQRLKSENRSSVGRSKSISSAGPRAPMASQYLQRVKSENRSSVGRPKAVDYKNQLLEHCRKDTKQALLGPENRRA